MIELEILFWYWWVLAVLLLGIEILAPGFFFLWMGISGFVTGCLLLLVPATSVEVQLFLFSVLSIISIIIWKVYVKKHPTESDQPLLNKRTNRYIGQTFTLIEAIENGRGKIKVDDSLWRVHGEDNPVGTKVIVTGVEGTVFNVERID